MWIFAKEGFVSIVADDDDPHTLLVRGRLPGDIEAVFPDAKVTKTPNADYIFRARIDRVDAAVRIAELVGRINYPNFKNAAPKERHGFLLRIWGIMIGEQDKLFPPRWIGRAIHKPRRRKKNRIVDPLIGMPLLPGEYPDLPWHEYPVTTYK